MKTPTNVSDGDVDATPPAGLEGPGSVSSAPVVAAVAAPMRGKAPDEGGPCFFENSALFRRVPKPEPELLTAGASL